MILLEELRVLEIFEEERALGDRRLKKAKVLSEKESSTLMEEVS